MISLELTKKAGDQPNCILEGDVNCIPTYIGTIYVNVITYISIIGHLPTYLLIKVSDIYI